MLRKSLYKYLFLYLVGGLIYCGIEILWRGHSHWTMLVVGGLCFVFCGSINEIFSWGMPLCLQMFICSVGITVIEFISGLIINIILKMGVWDYSNLPFNIMGQVCLLFSLIWFWMSFIAIVLDDWLRHWLFNEEVPRYRL